MSRWILTKNELPPKGEWVLTTTGDWQKPIEIKCYMGKRLGTKWVSIPGISGYKKVDYEYPAWTSGHGDIGARNPIAWMLLPKIPKSIEKISEEWHYRGGELE